MRQFIRTTLIGGALFLVPLVVVVVLVVKAFQLTKVAATPVAQLIPIESIAGIALVEIVTGVILLLGCFIAGMFARSAWGRSVQLRLDALLLQVFPGYAWIKGITGEISDAEAEQILKPVLVRFDDQSQLGFEVDRNADGLVAVYLPGAPNPRSGTVSYVNAEQIAPVDAGFREIATASKKLGRGTAEMLAR
jgi:uncharacterized membrane protein